MRRVWLVHWRESELPGRVDALEALGYDVSAEAFGGGDTYRAIRDDPSDAVVIDLSRLPSHGRETAIALRGNRKTRTIPLVFVGGVPEKVARLREQLPDAAYAPDWVEIGPVLRDALNHPPADPVVPTQMMNRYGKRSLLKKLGVQPGHTLALLGAPESFMTTLGCLPDGVTLRRQARGKVDIAVWFVLRQKDLAQSIAQRSAIINASAGRLWIAWPKKASGQGSDLSQQVVRRAGLTHGLVDFKIASLDATWSALCFVFNAS